VSCLVDAQPAVLVTPSVVSLLSDCYLPDSNGNRLSLGLGNLHLTELPRICSGLCLFLSIPSPLIDQSF
jgi:hypothetical protein